MNDKPQFFCFFTLNLARPKSGTFVFRPAWRTCLSRLYLCGMMFAIGAMCAAGLSQQTLSSTGLDADMEKLNEYIQADKTNEQSVETLYADLQHRFSVMKVRIDTLSTLTHPVHACRYTRGPFPTLTISYWCTGGYLKRGNGQRLPAR